MTDPVTRAVNPVHHIDVVARAADPGQDLDLSRGMLAQMDEAATGKHH